MKRILLTGFEPFSDLAINPSEVLVRDLFASLKNQDELHVDMMILPVDYDKAAKSIEQINFKNYDFIFQFGVASRRQRISLERVALNWIESTIPDNSGAHYNRQFIDAAGSNALFSPLDLASISQRLNSKWGDHTEVSLSAGAYLCNYVYYKSRAQTNACLFVHIPLKNEVDFSVLTKNIALDLIQQIL